MTLLLRDGAVRVPQMMVGVPLDSDDVYLRHQQVWQAMHATARAGCGQDFVFAEVAPRLFEVRSPRLRTGEFARLPAVGQVRPLRVSLVAMWGSAHDRPVAAGALTSWCGDRLRQHGLGLSALAIERVRECRGLKRGVPIRLQVVDVHAQACVVDAALAARAFVNGVGRGKRFGFGMLRFS